MLLIPKEDTTWTGPNSRRLINTLQSEEGMVGLLSNQSYQSCW